MSNFSLEYVEPLGESDELDEISTGFLNRVRTRVDRKAGMSNLAGWLCDHTRLDGKPFNFKDHEFQIGIVNDQSSRMAVKKCSQVGLSELEVRKSTGFCAVNSHKRVIYALPSRTMAQKFSKDRISGCINQSPILKGMVAPANDSAEQKLIGSCAMYVTGTWGDSGAISVPCEMVIVDELDFCNLEVVGKLSSRIRHASLDEHGFRGTFLRFSTPTLPGFGITAAFEKTRQSFYTVQCAKCNTRHTPSWYDDIVLPGFDDEMSEFLPGDLLNPRYTISKAYIKCPKCGSDLTRDLADPGRREWVQKYPDRIEAGYQVSPWDVPVYNTTPSILLQIGEYERLADFYNFVLGLEFEDPDSVFLEEIFDTCLEAQWWQYETVMRSINTFGGLDVGKVSHLTVGYQVGVTRHIVYAEEIVNSGGNPTLDQVNKRIKFFRCAKFCVDAGPDISLSQGLVTANPGRAFAVEYVTRPKGLKNFEVDDSTGIVKAGRTATLGALMKRHNSKKLQYPRNAVTEKLKVQLRNLKKVKRADAATKDDVEVFVKTGPDHFGHSLNYCNIAADMLTGGLGAGEFSAMPGVSKVKLGAKTQKADGRR